MSKSKKSTVIPVEKPNCHLVVDIALDASGHFDIKWVNHGVRSMTDLEISWAADLIRATIMRSNLSPKK